MRRRALLLLVPLVVAAACLPKDTRPPPAEIVVTASASDAVRYNLQAMFSATDGWDIYFSRVLVSLGQAEVGQDEAGSACNQYSNPDYTRLFDFKAVTAPREVGIAYATGHCPFGYTVRFPEPETLLDQGASESDRTFMRTSGSDRLATNQGISVYLEGIAAQGDTVKAFHWPFRRRLSYRSCSLEGAPAAAPNGSPSGAEIVGGEPSAGGEGGAGPAEQPPTRLLELASNEQVTVNIEVRPEALFRADDRGPFLFGPYAQADANDDGEITLDELFTVPLADVRDAGLYVPRTGSAGDGSEFACNNDDGDAVRVTTLGAYAYCVRLEHLTRFEQAGQCIVFAGRRRGD